MEEMQIEFNRPKKYKLIKRIGSGACGVTVHLHDEELDIQIVAKKFKPIIDKNTDLVFFLELLNRFKQEARILFRVNHPNIVRVFNFYNYPDDDTAFILMEYVEGENILEHIEAHPNDAALIFEKTVSGFAHLEERRVLHRDIRPDNILIGSNNEPVILDSGKWT